MMRLEYWVAAAMIVSCGGDDASLSGQTSDSDGHSDLVSEVSAVFEVGDDGDLVDTMTATETFASEVASELDADEVDDTIVDTAVDVPETAEAEVNASDNADAPVEVDPEEIVEVDPEEIVEVDPEEIVDVDPEEIVDVDDTSEDTEIEDADSGPSGWRSALYPDDWTPAFTAPDGEFLHDFSYAGYHHGELAVGLGLGPNGVDGLARFDVTTYGATGVAFDSSELATDATAGIQAAIDAAEAAGGGLVWVPAGLYRVDGVLSVRASRVVIGGVGPDASRLWFTRVNGMSHAAHLDFAGKSTLENESLLTTDGLARATEIAIADASAFSVGDDIQIGQVITDAFIAEHGMTGIWQAFNGTWQPFFHRTVVAVDADAKTLTVDVPLRYVMKTAYQASVRRVSGLLKEVGLQDIALANAGTWDEAWALDQVHAAAFEHVADAWVARVATFASPRAPAEGRGAGAHLLSSGIRVHMSKRVTIADTHLARAQNRGSGGNGYLFEIRQSSEILTRDSSGTLGRHNFIQNWGFGTTGCVWLRVLSTGGENWPSPDLDFSLPAFSEYHHSLATANLFDQSVAEDGFKAANRLTESTGAGHSATECVFWNIGGTIVTSRQYGRGYVIGTAPGMLVATTLGTLDGLGTEPADWVEGAGDGATLTPPSLYEDQLARRLR